MSVRVMSWVLQHSQSRLGDRLVLIAIADNAASSGGDSWPSISEICQKAGMSQRNVYYAIESLQKMGELKVQKKLVNRRWRNCYTIVMTPAESAPQSPADSSPEESSAERSDSLPLQNPTPTPATSSGDKKEQPSKEPSKEPSRTSELALRGDDAARPDVERLCEHLADRVEQNGSKRPTITKKWRDAARLLIDKDGRTEQQVHTAIDWCQNSEFWRANIMSMPKLRDKYDQMRLQAQRESGNGKQRPSTTDQRVQAGLELAARYAERGE